MFSPKTPPHPPNPKTSSIPKHSLPWIIGWSVPAGCLHTHVARTIRLFFLEAAEQKYRKTFNRLNRETFRKKFSDTKFFVEIIFYPSIRRVWGCVGYHSSIHVHMYFCVCVSVCTYVWVPPLFARRLAIHQGRPLGEIALTSRRVGRDNGRRRESSAAVMPHSNTDSHADEDDENRGRHSRCSTNFPSDNPPSVSTQTFYNFF